MSSHAMKSTVPANRNGQRLLKPGMRLSQAEFHRRYELYPEDVKFELVGGVVHMASPQKVPGGRYQGVVAGLLGMYQFATPGVELLIGSTTILDDDNESQPDLSLRIIQGGQSDENAEEYIVGAPELLVEISDSSEYLDRHKKGPEYERTGVAEYLLVLVERQEIHWFNFAEGGMIEPNRRGVARSRIFPGLWLHIPALLELDAPRASDVLQRGLDSREHQALVRRLARRQSGS